MEIIVEEKRNIDEDKECQRVILTNTGNTHNCLEKVPTETDTFVVIVENGGEYDHGREERSTLEKLKNDPDYRHRVLHTACVCCSMTALGWRTGLVGLTLPDLRQIMDEDLATASWIFTAMSLGGLIGSVGGGIIYDRSNKLALFVAITSVFAALSAITPWCANFPAMLVVHMLIGVVGGAIDTVANADTMFVWRHNCGPFLQTIHLGFSIGFILSSLIANPFLAQRMLLNPTHGNLVNDTLITLLDYSAPLSPAHIPTNVSPSTLTTDFIEEFPIGLFNYTSKYVQEPEYTYGKTRIHIVYLITMGFCLLVSCLFLFQYFLLGSVYNKPFLSHKGSTDVECLKTDSRFPKSEISNSLKTMFAIVVSIILMLHVINEKNFSSYLMTFTISELCWSKTKGTNATATFSISFAVGRLLIIGVSNIMKPSIILISFIFILSVGVSGLWISVEFDFDILIWISTAVIGFGMAPMTATLFNWLSENVLKITGKLTGMMHALVSIGTMLFPLLSSYLMANVSFMWFCYLQFILSITMGVVFLTTETVFQILIKRC